MQETTNQIIEKFFDGGKRGIASACKLYKDTFFDENGGFREDFAFCGNVIENDLMEFDRDHAERLGGFVPEERVDALADGAEPTQDERGEYRNRVISEVEGGTFDWDVIPGYYIYNLRHTDGREVFALETVTGYSFSGVDNTFHGLFSSAEDALNDLSRCGLVVRR
jgi:hypothetical protein